jgi:hypothetical protein
MPHRPLSVRRHVGGRSLGSVVVGTTEWTESTEQAQHGGAETRRSSSPYLTSVLHFVR